MAEHGLIVSEVGEKYVLRSKIGAGSFGEVYLATDKTSQRKVAVKIEKSNCKHPQLLYEAKIINYLSHPKPLKGIPRVLWCGVEGGYNVMVINLLGKNLHQLMNRTGGKFSIKTVLMIAIQAIKRLETLHSKNFIHRDLKPENLLFGVGSNKHVLYMVDYGLAKRYCNGKGEHIEYVDNKSFTGTARYASVNNHMKIEQSRRDDMESLGYVLVYLFNGSLPWQGIHSSTTRDKYARICEKKLELDTKTLCQNMPPEFVLYFNHVKSLGFEDEPNYKYLAGLFSKRLKQDGFENDGVYDWTRQQESNS